MTSPWASISSIWVLFAKVQFKLGERHEPLALSGINLETSERVEIGVPKLLTVRRPLYPTGPQALLVCIDAEQLIACHLALGWRLPDRIVDLMVEFRRISNGAVGAVGGLAGALIWFGRRTAGAFAMGLSPNEMRTRLSAVVELYRAMRAELDLGRAALRGRFICAVARIEATGIPVDRRALHRLLGDWPAVKSHATRTSGLKNLPRALSEFDPSRLSVGRDGRNRVSLRPFASITGRNQPSSRGSVLYSAAWVRHLIVPAPGTALALIDWKAQEFAVAAALSGDPEMQAAYRSGDPYLALAVRAGAAPSSATARDHGPIRERFKAAVLAIQYGMGTRGLARQLGITFAEADDILRAHRSAFPRFWSWSDAVETRALLRKELQSVFGWRLQVGPDANPRSLRNFAVQANGAELMRLATILATEQGITVCGVIHDALMIEAPSSRLDEAIARTRAVMAEASAVVLDGLIVRTDVRVTRAPDRWREPRGATIWAAVSEAISLCKPPVRQRHATCSSVHSRSISLSVYM